MDRPTHEITTPAGKVVILKDYITARERNEIRSVVAADVTMIEGVAHLKEIKAGLLDAAERKVIETIVTSYEGSTENIVDRLLDASPEEYDFVRDEANKISNFQKAK